MASFKDIGPLTATVNIRGKDYEVSGINADDVFDLIVDYPDLEKLLATKVKDFNPMMLVRTMPKAVGMMIACAIGQKGNLEEVDLANKLGFGNQVKLMAAIFELTFMDGVGPFVDELKALTKMIRPNIKGSDTDSPARVSAQFVMVGAGKKFGAQRRANSTRGSNSASATN